MNRVILTSLLLAACSSGPPPDFAPAPELVSRIRELRMTPLDPAVCPGERIRVRYEAVLDDQTVIPFETRYDEDRPPRLHVRFLTRTSGEAAPQNDGSWIADDDPFVSVRSGFRIRAALQAQPAVADSVTVAPEYDCLPRNYTARGANGTHPSGRNSAGRGGGPGGDGPDVTVRLGVVRSPFVDRLLVAAIEIGDDPTVFYLADAERITPRDWLQVESQGGHGGRGADGAPGQPGTAGAAGCPGSPGGAGGNGQNGGSGGLGGRGGRVTIIVAAEEPFLAGLVDARNPGGQAGQGGNGGAGGLGGAGGAAQRPECAAGAAGPAGNPGSAGRTGRHGVDGPRPLVMTVPLRQVFGSEVPWQLAELLNPPR